MGGGNDINGHNDDYIGTYMEHNKLKINWDTYFYLCDIIIQRILDKQIEPFTDIVAISRGGLLPAQYIAYKLNIPKIHCFSVSTYNTSNTKIEDEQIDIYQKVTAKFTLNNRILIVDDIADSGKTIQLCIDEHKNFPSAKDVKVATLHYKREKSIIKPDYYASIVGLNTWIVYPYDFEDIT